VTGQQALNVLFCATTRALGDVTLVPETVMLLPDDDAPAADVGAGAAGIGTAALARAGAAGGTDGVAVRGAHAQQRMSPTSWPGWPLSTSAPPADTYQLRIVTRLGFELLGART
jgi:hypothetical protein